MAITLVVTNTETDTNANTDARGIRRSGGNSASDADPDAHAESHADCEPQAVALRDFYAEGEFYSETVAERDGKPEAVTIHIRDAQTVFEAVDNTTTESFDESEQHSGGQRVERAQGRIGVDDAEW